MIVPASDHMLQRTTVGVRIIRHMLQLKTIQSREMDDILFMSKAAVEMVRN